MVIVFRGLEQQSDKSRTFLSMKYCIFIFYRTNQSCYLCGTRVFVSQTFGYIIYVKV